LGFKNVGLKGKTALPKALGAISGEFSHYNPVLFLVLRFTQGNGPERVKRLSGAELSGVLLISAILEAFMSISR
jgi:hypothetical protein